MSFGIVVNKLQEVFYSNREMARKNRRGSLPSVVPLEEQEENTIYDSDFSPSSDEPDSGRDTRQNSGFSFTKPRKVVGANRHPYAMSFGTNKPRKLGKANNLIRQSTIKDSDSIIEKAKSQKRLKFHELQNEIQLHKTKQKDLENENKLLKRTQRRQAVALKRYEGSEGELPSLLRSHQEEVRTLRELLKKSNEKQRLSEKRESEKAVELEKARIQLQRLQGIVREQHLDERIALNKKVDFFQNESQEREKKIREMQHHLELRDKNYKHQLAIEFARHKETKKKLLEVQVKADKLSVLLKEKERELDIRNIYTAHIGNKSPRKSTSVSPKQKAKREIKKLNDSKDEELQNIDQEPNNFFCASNLELYQLKQRNILPNIETKPQKTITTEETKPEEIHYNFMDEIRRKSFSKETSSDSFPTQFNSDENQDESSDLKQFTREICVNDLLKPLPKQSQSQGSVSDLNKWQSTVSHTQDFQIWVTSSRPGSNESIETNRKPLSAKAKKSNLMLQLFGNINNDNNNSTNNDDDFPLQHKPSYEITSGLDSGISSSDSGFLLPRRPREKSNLLPKNIMSPIPGAIEDETSPLLL